MSKQSRMANLKDKRAHLDHLSETEGETSKTDDEDEHRAGRASGLKPMTPANGKGTSNGASKGRVDSGAGRRAGSRGRSPFMPKAIAAIATFAMSVSGNRKLSSQVS